MSVKAWAALALWVLATAACTPSHSPVAAKPRNVFVIVMENHSASEALNAPFTASLARRYGVAQNYHAVAHPSVPNYLALTSGSTWGLQDDGYHVLPTSDLGTQLTNAHVTWRAYMEGLTDRGCLNSPVPYDPGHDPFVYYGGQCPTNVVPLSDMTSDLSGGSPPRFVWITPDMCHDTHSCDVAVGDAWLRQEVGEITASRAWKNGGVLFITWDEDDSSSDNHVLTLVVAQGVGHRTSSKPYSHYSLLASVEDLLGVGRLGQASGATPMSDLLSS